MTSRASTDPITWPGTSPSCTRHSGSSARPTSGSLSHFSSRVVSVKKSDRPGWMSRISSILCRRAVREVAPDDGVVLARAVHPVVAGVGGGDRHDQLERRAAPPCRAPRSGRPAAAACPPRSSGAPMPSAPELVVLRGAVVGDDALVRKQTASAPGQLRPPVGDLLRRGRVVGAAAREHAGDQHDHHEQHQRSTTGDEPALADDVLRRTPGHAPTLPACGQRTNHNSAHRTGTATRRSTTQSLRRRPTVARPACAP